jgi:thioesterase superfamily protein
MRFKPLIRHIKRTGKGLFTRVFNNPRGCGDSAPRTFADYCLFAFASPVLKGPGVTMSFACEFLDAAGEGDLIEATGEITRTGGSLIFLRGMLNCGERKLFAFSGTIKRVKMRLPAAAGVEPNG